MALLDYSKMSGTDSTVEVIIVTASDEGYFSLARDMIESLLDQGRNDIAIGFLDLGLSSDQREWLAERKIMVGTPKSNLKMPLLLLVQKQLIYRSYQKISVYLAQQVPLNLLILKAVY